MTRRLLAVFAVLGLLVVSCSDSSDDGADETTTSATTDEEQDGEDEEEADVMAFDDWVDEVNDVCSDYQGDADDLGQSLGEVEEGDFETLVDLLEDGEALLEDRLADIEELGPPDEEADQAEEWLDVLRDQIDIVGDVIAAAEDEDEDAMVEAFDEADDSELEAAELAEDLDLDECADLEDSSGPEGDSADPVDSGLTAGDEGDLLLLFEEALNQQLLAQGLTETEAQCITGGVLSRFTTEDLLALDESDPEVQDAIVDVTLNCV